MKISNAFYFVVLTSFISSIAASSGEKIKVLVKQLFTDREYNKFVIPLTNINEMLNVTFNLDLTGLNSVVENEGVMVTSGHLFVSWIDEFLKWNVNDPNNSGIEYFNIPQTEVWKPDLRLENGFGQIREFGDVTMNVIVFYDGAVVWKPFQKFDSQCSFDTKKYPFDEHICNLIFTPWSYGAHLRFKRGSSFKIKNTDAHGEWNITGFTVKYDNTSEHDKAIFVINLRRKPALALINIIIPAIILSLLNLCTFVFPTDSGEKMGYSMTVFLSFAVFLTMVNDSLPKNADKTSNIGLYLMIQLFQSVLIIILSSVQLRLFNRNPTSPVSCPLKSCLYSIMCARCRVHPAKTQVKLVLSNSSAEINNTSTAEVSDDLHSSVINWKDVCDRIDMYSFFIFTIVFFVSTTVFFLSSL